MEKIKILFVLAVMGSSITACGNKSLQQSDAYLNSGTGTSSSANFTENSFLPVDEQCSENTNINSNISSPSSAYRACRGSTTGSVQLFDADQATKSICVFPALNGRTNPTLYKCINTNSGGSTVSFGSLNFNQIFVIDAANLRIMVTCSQYQQQYGSDVPTCAAAANMPMGSGSI